MIYPWLEPDWKALLAQRTRLHHALLIHGPAGIGKSAFATELARSLLCESPLPDGAACGRCSACGWFAQDNHPDLRRLAPTATEEGIDAGAGVTGEPVRKPGSKGAGRPSRDIRIDQVRALERFIEVSGHRGATRIVLIDPADALNAAATNALLKTLEEPGRGARFVLVTDRPDTLPATIRSRCRALALPRPAADVGAAWLAADTGADLAQAQAWLAAAGDAPLRARRFADPAQAAIHRLLVETVAGLPETGVVQAADALADIAPAIWMTTLQTWVVDLQRTCAGAQPRYFPDRADRLGVLARQAGLVALDRLAVRLDRAARTIDHPLNPRLMLEDVLLEVRHALAARAS
ncbi:MAG: DNA polymerase III subunit delta' [Burkholderiaceae bacterium]|nr:DNA polymerase III subunit delta' [Burkholderiaceae bacterium]MEB2351120.1 DNA polymerase III subunit delta' [Burkholderiaceae bacterium]